MSDTLQQYADRLEALAHTHGLDYFPVDFEQVPANFMMEVAVYGLPVRMPHWSFGVRYIHHLVQHKMGHSQLYEVVFPGNPGRAYLSDTNSLADNTLVVAHVLGHADFSRNNLLFQSSQQQVGYQFVEQAAAHARTIGDAIDTHGRERVERVLDAALALEQHIDIHQPLMRERYPVYVEQRLRDTADPFLARYTALTVDEAPAVTSPAKRRASVPPHPEGDLLWFIAQYAPELDEWERDIFLAVRKESYYFYPVYACQIMNEGWACLWHSTLLREADFLPHELYLDAIKTHSDVVRPYAGDNQVALALNPYHIGFTIWNHIVERDGLDTARQIMEREDDFGFIRNYLTAELIEELGLFRYRHESGYRIKIEDQDVDSLRELLLQDKYNFGAPHVYVRDLGDDNSLTLIHAHETDGRGLDLARAEKVLSYLHSVWRRAVRLYTIDPEGKEKVLEAG